ncbi:MAG: GNAT family N-acetyltransferase [Anaerolineales bacterium]|nr:GNAT family N-acetyltransferase [Anaerolineales bacterium]
MQLRRYVDPGDFLAAAEAFLLTREATNNVLLGLAATLRISPGFSLQPPYFSVVEAEGAVVAAGLITPPNRLHLAYTEVPGALDLLVADVRNYYPLLPGVTGPVPVARGFAERWQRLTGARYARTMAERNYQLTQVRAPTPVPGAMRRAGPDDLDLLADWYLAFEVEAFGESTADSRARVERVLATPGRAIYLWEADSRAVSLAGYGNPTPHGIRIGPVYTPSERRGRGFASALVAQLSQRLLDEGRQYVFLFTDQKNATANHIYQAIGYRPVNDADEFKFTSRAD